MRRCDSGNILYHPAGEAHSDTLVTAAAAQHSAQNSNQGGGTPLSRPCAVLSAASRWILARGRWVRHFRCRHLFNSGENLIGAFEVFLFAIFACLTQHRAGNLWFAIGFHAAGDYAETLLSVRDSGFAASGTLLNSFLQAPAWLTGGKVGSEASVFSMLLLCVAMFCFQILYPQPSRQAKQVAQNLELSSRFCEGHDFSRAVRSLKMSVRFSA